MGTAEGGPRVPVKDRKAFLRQAHPEFPADFFDQMTPTGIPQDFASSVNGLLLYAHALLFPREVPELTTRAKQQFPEQLRTRETLSEYWRRRTVEHNTKTPENAKKLDPKKVVRILVTDHPEASELEEISVSLAGLAPSEDHVLGEDQLAALARQVVTHAAATTKLLDPVYGEEKSKKILKDNGLVPEKLGSSAA